jgi:hypothetical protein
MGAKSAAFVVENLNELAFNGVLLAFALDQHYNLSVADLESDHDVNFVFPVWTPETFFLVDHEVLELGIARLSFEPLFDKRFEFVRCQGHGVTRHRATMVTQKAAEEHAYSSRPRRSRAHLVRHPDGTADPDRTSEEMPGHLRGAPRRAAPLASGS